MRATTVAGNEQVAENHFAEPSLVRGGVDCETIAGPTGASTSPLTPQVRRLKRGWEIEAGGGGGNPDVSKQPLFSCPGIFSTAAGCWGECQVTFQLFNCSCRTPKVRSGLRGNPTTGVPVCCDPCFPEPHLFRTATPGGGGRPKISTRSSKDPHPKNGGGRRLFCWTANPPKRKTFFEFFRRA